MIGAHLLVAALASSARVQLNTPGGMCLATSNGSVRFVPCVLANSWELKDGQVRDPSGACIALARDGSVSLAAGCAVGGGARAAALKSEKMWFGWGRCLARDGNGVKVVKGECAPLRAEPLWSFAIQLDASRSPQVVFSANPHLAAYLCVVLASIGIALLVAMCLGSSAQVAHKSSPPTSSTRVATLPVAVKCYASSDSATPVKVELTPQ
jgi:hypothetical protein